MIFPVACLLVRCLTVLARHEAPKAAGAAHTRARSCVARPARYCPARYCSASSSGRRRPVYRVVQAALKLAHRVRLAQAVRIGGRPHSLKILTMPGVSARTCGATAW